MLTLLALRIELGKSYRQTIELVNEMLSILEEIGLTRLPHYTVLHDWFETSRWPAGVRPSEGEHRQFVTFIAPTPARGEAHQA